MHRTCQVGSIGMTAHVRELLPPVISSLHISSAESQTISNLTKLIEKSINIHRTKSISLDSLWNVVSYNNIFGIVYVDIF